MSKKSKNQYEDALSAAEELNRRSDEALYEELGLRIEDMQNIGGYGRSKLYSSDDFAQPYANDMQSTDKLREIGKRWYKKLEAELMKVICEENNEDMKKITSGKTVPQIAASLATAGVVSLMAPPAWLIVAVSIIAAKVAKSGLDAVCEVWRESLGSANQR
jgi:hypothetical protein